MLSFHIEDKDFYYNPTVLDEFIVKSRLKPYQVLWDDTLEPFNKINAELNKNPNNLLLIDKNVYEIYHSFITYPKTKIFLIPATEAYKSLTGVTQILNFLQTHGLTKSETLIVVGGGITQDISGFVAAIYKRGIRRCLFPTTLLSMCDSCMGGKTGINYNEAKNQLALFSAPHKVIINTAFLNSLKPNDIKSGLGEIFKLFITAGDPIFSNFKKYVKNRKIADPKFYKPLILTALSIKKSVIEEDEFEENYRKSMNYGHTIGHAIESLTNYAIPHGLAVVIGIMLANELSHAHGLLTKNILRDLHQQALELLDADILNELSTL